MKIKRGSANSKIAMVANLFNSPIWNFLRYKEYATVIIIKIAPIIKGYSLYFSISIAITVLFVRKIICNCPS